jgi:hypothetical protein
MANEIKVRVSLSFSKSGVRDGAEATGSFTLASSVYNRGRQTIGTSSEALNVGDVVTGGWCYIENLDATNYVEVRAGGSTDSDFVIRLLPGEFSIFRLSVTALAPKLRANTAPVDVEFLVLSA